MIKTYDRVLVEVGDVNIGGCSSMVEPQPSKLMMWVRFPSPAPKNRIDRLNVVIEKLMFIWIESRSENGIVAHIAQSVEHFLGKEEVTGSNPVMSSTFGFY